MSNWVFPFLTASLFIKFQDRNEKLFFRLLAENVEEMMPIVYTPTVGLACQKFGLIYRRPRGLFVTINDRGHVFDVLKNWPEPDVSISIIILNVKKSNNFILRTRCEQ